MIKILVYGDSNVWGDNFNTGVRIPDDKQWTNILQDKLGNNYKVLQEGLPGRIAGSNEQDKKYKNGKDTFISTYRSNAPLDILLISLGTNDLQIKYNKTSDEIINDLLWYRNVLVKMKEDPDNNKKYFIDSSLPKIIYILPSNFNYGDSVIFDETREIERQKIINAFENSNINNIYFNDIDLFEDGIHFNYEGHKKMANKVYKKIVEL